MTMFSVAREKGKSIPSTILIALVRVLEGQWSGFDTRYPPSGGKVNVKSKAPLESNICQWSFDSSIRKRDGREGMRMFESGHQE
jgi:hypothetical protein